MFSTRISRIVRPMFASARNFSEGGGHPDFAKRFKAPAASEKEIHDRIARDVKAADIVLYMKGTPEAPQCGFSQAVVKVLKAEGVPFKAHNVLADDALRQHLKTFTDWPTIPQIFIKGEFVGGCDILVGMYQAGDLHKTLLEKGIKKDKS
ncbi:mitochondrial iron-sulfur cluster biosynthesis Grx5 (monothiol glutaredoxin-5) [Andalucia godoyi]|uniref:Mitochondrial iron-sulfur cluster biosynthesis Grx5 (Monothiol glutaredoxin-5) n=1 Tax=Andalucia godoyi TaxID=505711 RepID=A0A8K0AJY3_ANDGO|nr:mitochondrial iron-sulfur cluster biosynthesis Grx5 (monothiol glutaredoxin-5) [Andalucia godoyi]|eukprot:ANDGO_06811.mRNA.1 mitochondrial iron-sulfur cluster biosynthesis Grx5 (monothiol glutaredoxin-5)